MNHYQDAFISYGRADSKAFAVKLYEYLTQKGLKVWFDFENIPLGVDFQNQIDDGIEKADNFLFIIAPHSINSPYCLKEIELALKYNKRIIPLLHVEQISRDTWQQRYPNGTDEDWQAYTAKGLHSSFPNMHPEIGKINWVYFREGLDDCDTAFTGLLDIFQRHREYVASHTHFLNKALDWERNQKRCRYLLVGEERKQGQDWLKVRFRDEQPPCTPTDLHSEYITESIKNANNLMTQVFLAYAHEDKSVMEKIGNSLRREGFTVWTNTSDIQTGEAFEKAIKRGIEQADNLVYLLSPETLQSRYCQQELSYALSHNKRIIPVLVRETKPELIPPTLHDLQYIDLTNNVKEEDYLLDESQLLKILHQDEAYHYEHKVLLVKALKWKEQAENPSILLRGYNLRSAEAWLKVAKQRQSHPPTRLQEEFINESLRQPPATSLDVFVSYSRSDSDFARQLNDALQIQGKTTWFDQESIASGADFQQEIYRGIEVCDNFVFILSPRSINSPYCADEVEYAAKLNKRLVTILHQDVNPTELHPELAKIQWIAFNRSDSDFATNFSQLIRTLDTDRDHVHSHTKWSQQALEWQEKGNHPDLLLRGSELVVAREWLQRALEQKKKPVPTELQQTFVRESEKAIRAAEAAEKERQAQLLRLQEEKTKEAEARLAEQKKSAKRQKVFLTAVSALLLASVGATVVAFHQRRQAVQQRERAEKVTEGQIKALGEFSWVLSQSEKDVNALIEGIRAARILKNLDTEEAELKEPILTALEATLYKQGFRERNTLTKHEYSVTSVAFSPDGETIASVSDDRTVKLWNLQGKELFTVQGHQDTVWSVAFSPDGQTIASASGDGTIKLWNLQGKELFTVQGHQDTVWSVAFSPDGQTIASASEDRTVKLWNRQGKLLQTLQGHQNEATSVVFSPDGQAIASGDGDGTIKLWNRQGRLLQTLQGHQDEATSVAFSPDGQTIASGSKDQTIKLWNRQGELLQTLAGHQDTVWSVTFSPNGETIASASKDKVIKLWNRQGELLQTLQGHQDAVNSVAFSPNGETIASASVDTTIKLWNPQQEILQTLQGHQDVLRSVAFSPNGEAIASASADKTVKLWNRQGELLQTLQGHQNWVNSVAFSPDGEAIASASGDGTIKLWNRQGDLLQTLQGHQDGVTSVAFSPNGETIASASGDGTIKLWNRQGELLQTLRGHEDYVLGVAFSPDGETIASASYDHTIKLWTLQGKLLETLQGHQDYVLGVAFSPDGQTLASASKDKTVKLWNRQGKLLQTLQGHQNWVISVAFSPDGETIASASFDRTLKLWNRQGKLLQTLQGHQDGVWSVVFSPNGETIASASFDKTVKLWNLSNLTLDSLMQDACAWVGDYLKHNAPEINKDLCNGVSK